MTTHANGAQTTGYIAIAYYENMASYNYQNVTYVYRYAGATADMTSAGYYNRGLIMLVGDIMFGQLIRLI